ncbi:MAG: hypothetical protein ACPHY8_04150 [Patescibacteria group bacterium]
MFKHISDNVLEYCKTAVKIPLIFAGLQSIVLLVFVLFVDFQFSFMFLIIPFIYLLKGYSNLKFFELFEKSVEYLLYKNVQKVLSKTLFFVLLFAAVFEIIYQQNYIFCVMFLVDVFYKMTARKKRIYESINELAYFKGYAG